jgi:hypothetical protein
MNLTFWGSISYTDKETVLFSKKSTLGLGPNQAAIP